MKYNRHMTFNIKGGIKRLIFSLFFLMFSFFIQAQPGEAPQQHFQSTNETDTLFNKREIIVLNATKDTLEIAGYKNGEKHGQQKLFYSNGDLKLIANYKKGLLKGKVEYFAQNSQQLLGVERYKANPKQRISVLQGQVKNYYSNGQISEDFSYKNGKKNGKYKIYYANGQLKEEGKYIDNLNKGRKRTYNAEGTLIMDEHFTIIDDPKYIEAVSKTESTKEEISKLSKKLAVLDGKVKYYYRSGLLASDLKFKNGDKDGFYKEFYEDKNNSLKSKISFKKGLEHGSFVRYYQNGKIKSKGKYYQEVKVGDSVYNSVYDGRIISYYDNGFERNLQKSAIENWKNYKKNGVYEKYSSQRIPNEPTELSYRCFYLDNLKTGIEEYFDKSGNITYRRYLEIVKIDGIKVSQQTGLESKWKYGKIISTTEWRNNEKNGINKIYYENGQLERLMNFKDGELNGLYQTYYENGQLNKHYIYQTTPNTRQLRHIGWNKAYDESGEIIRIFYAQEKGNNSIGLNFENGKLKELAITDALKISLSSDQKIENIYWLKNSRPYFGYDMFSNQQLRRVHFNAVNYSPVAANFDGNGKFIQVHSITGKIIEDEQINEIAQKIAAQYNPEWNNEELVTKGFKDGKYQWNYADGSPFFKIEFKDSLPQGTWINYNPILADTLFKREYEKGLPVGEWIEKTIDGVIVSRIVYFQNHNVKENYRYGKSGVIQEISKYDSMRKETYHANFFENGQLKDMRDPVLRNNLSMREDGDTSSYNFLFTKGDSIQLERQFYENNKISQERRNNLSTGVGLLKTYHKNGRLQSLHELKDNKSDGVYKRLDQYGDLLTLGHFKDGNRNGKWIKYPINGDPEVSQFEYGEIIINKSEEDENTCKCYDKSLKSGSIGFAGLLSLFTEYENILHYLPKTIIPVDHFNYENIFYVNLQTSNNRSAGFSRMKLLMVKEFSFHYPAVNYLKFNLNPCKTEGYVSNIVGTFNYNYSEEKILSAYLGTKRIAISLEKNPLVDVNNKTPFTAYFDTEGMEFNQDGIENIRFSKDENTCYSLGLIKDFMDIEIQKTKLDIRPSNGKFSNLPLLPIEVKQFYGFDISEAIVAFNYITETDSIRITASTDRIVAGANYVAGRIKVDGKSATKKEFTVKGTEKTININKLQRFIEQKGFYRVKVEISEGQLWIEFYTVK